MVKDIVTKFPKVVELVMDIFSGTLRLKKSA